MGYAHRLGIIVLIKVTASSSLQAIHSDEEERT